MLALRSVGTFLQKLLPHRAGNVCSQSTTATFKNSHKTISSIPTNTLSGLYTPFNRARETTAILSSILHTSRICTLTTSNLLDKRAFHTNTFFAANLNFILNTRSTIRTSKKSDLLDKRAFHTSPFYNANQSGVLETRGAKNNSNPNNRIIFTKANPDIIGDMNRLFRQCYVSPFDPRRRVTNLTSHTNIIKVELMGLFENYLDPSKLTGETVQKLMNFLGFYDIVNEQHAFLTLDEVAKKMATDDNDDEANARALYALHLAHYYKLCYIFPFPEYNKINNEGVGVPLIVTFPLSEKPESLQKLKQKAQKLLQSKESKPHKKRGIGA